MKKKVTIIVIIVAIIALAVYIVSFFYPPDKGDDSAGTIGKVEKFRKGLYTQEDILLRDDILEDTAAVGKTLDQVVAFYSFMNQEKVIIDSLWIKQIKETCPPRPGCAECANCEKAVNLLQDYCDFLNNKKETVKTAIDILLAAYNGKSKDFSFDVGVKLLAFIQFVDEMIERDSVLTTSISMIDQYISKEKVTDKKREAEMIRLKKVRDHMVIDNLLFAMRTGDKRQSEQLSKTQLSNVDNTIGNILSHPDFAENIAPNIGTSQVAAAVETTNVIDPIAAADYVMNSPNIGCFGNDRVHDALNTVVIVAYDNTLGTIRYNTVVLDCIGVTEALNIPNNTGVFTIDNIVGPGYQIVVENTPTNIFGSLDGSIFNVENIGILIEPM